jgi:hypothetical protein
MTTETNKQEVVIVSSFGLFIIFILGVISGCLISELIHHI